MRVERKPLGEQVTALIRSMIQGGELAAGERLVEEQLAQETGTSRTPIREAFHRLEQEGLVVRRIKGGYKVRPLTALEVEETIGVRAALESYAVELACKNQTPEFIAKLEANVEKFAAALENNNQKKLVKLNTEFHQMLYDTAGSGLLERMATDLAETLHRFRLALLADADSAGRSLGDHRKMLKALKEGNPLRAGQVCREHIMTGGSLMLARLKKENIQE